MFKATASLLEPFLLKVAMDPHQGQPWRPVYVLTVAVAARTRNTGAEGAGISPLTVASQRSVSVILTNPACAVAQIARLADCPLRYSY
jgi:hypothetical protein